MSNGDAGTYRYEGAAPQLLRALRDMLPENWPSSQAIVAIVTFVAVAWAFIYGLLRDAPAEPDTARALYFRLSSRSSSPERQEHGFVEMELYARSRTTAAVETPAPR